MRKANLGNKDLLQNVKYLIKALIHAAFLLNVFDKYIRSSYIRLNLTLAKFIGGSEELCRKCLLRHFVFCFAVCCLICHVSFCSVFLLYYVILIYFLQEALLVYFLVLKNCCLYMLRQM